MALRKSKSVIGAGRSETSLNARMEKYLSGYATAAVAAGVSLLALSRSADAKIVYTPANTNIPTNGGPVPLDLNHDGIVDFSFLNLSTQAIAWSFTASAKVQGNRMWGKGSFAGILGPGPFVFASALRARFEVGPNRSYFKNGDHGVIAAGFESNYGTGTFGQWLYTKYRYLGLKFMIDGQIHYGWARVSVTKLNNKIGVAATLTGYAYETIPNKPIVAGKTKGPDVITWEPATLGHLAQGASGISAWREKK
jgi:hypothetical protein